MHVSCRRTVEAIFLVACAFATTALVHTLMKLQWTLIHTPVVRLLMPPGRVPIIGIDDGINCVS